MVTRVQRSQTTLPFEDRAQAMHILSYAFKLPEAWGDARSLLLSLAPQMEQLGNRDEWLPYLMQGLDQSLHLGDVVLSAELQLQIGILQRLQGSYDNARTQLEASLHSFESVSSLVDQARVLNELAHVARLQRQFDRASNLVEKALGLLDAEDTERAYSYLILGLVAYDKRVWSETINFCYQALNLWESENNQRMVARVLTILGAALHRMGTHTEAIAVYERASDLFEQTNDMPYLAVVQMNLGNVYLELDQSAVALDLYRPAERTFRRVQDRHHLTMVQHNMGMAYHQLQHWEQAEQAYQVSIKLKGEIGNIASLVNTKGDLGLLYLAQERFEEAVTTFNEALNLLAQIQDEPGYDYLNKTMTTHLQEAIEQSNNP